MNQRSSAGKKAFISRAGWYSLSYPEQWEIEEDEYIAIYDPLDGVGVLHVSAYEAPEAVDPRAELLEHLSENHPSIHLQDIQTSVDGGKTVANFESIDDNSFDKVWFVGQGPYLVIATYHSDPQDKDKEINETEEIIRSIAIVPGLSRN